MLSGPAQEFHTPGIFLCLAENNGPSHVPHVEDNMWLFGVCALI